MSKIELMRTFAKAIVEGVRSPPVLARPFQRRPPNERTLPDGWTAYHKCLPLAKPAGVRGRLQTRIRRFIAPYPVIVPDSMGRIESGRRAAMSIQHAAPMSERFVESTLPCGLQP